MNQAAVDNGERVRQETLPLACDDVFPPLPDTRFDIIYADPPWDYKGHDQHSTTASTGGATAHYQTADLRTLKRLEVPMVAADSCLLFMWATSPHLDQAIELGKAWSFDWGTVAFVWDKQRTNPGYYTLSQCELCLVFRRGSIPEQRGARDVRQLVSEQRREHSRKPDEVRLRIETMFPTARRLELFARGGVRDGWESWGLEAGTPLAEMASL